MLRILLSLQDIPKDMMASLHGHNIDTIRPERRVHEIVAKKKYDIALIEGETELLEAIKTADPRVEVILFGEGEENAVDALKHGAFAYISKPPDLRRLSEMVARIQKAVNTQKETAELEQQLISKYIFSGVVGKNPLMLDIFNFIKRIAPYYKTVTILGETGTGKEAIARALHHTSPVSDRPFVACNCSSLVESLVESELFGHERGAFTGAMTDKKGLFEAAGDGTIFLDEIGDLPLSFQPHLLRVLQDGEFRRVGSHKISKASCRIIAATNRNLADEVAKGKFRQDLFYRLTPLLITVPPLRDRKDDIPLLCRFFLEKFNTRTGKDILGISRPAQSTLMMHDWPGNVRELENAIEQASILTTESFIRLSDLPDTVKTSDLTTFHKATSLDEVIKRHIEKALNQCGGNRTRTANMLGISRRSLLRKIHKYSL